LKGASSACAEPSGPRHSGSTRSACRRSSGKEHDERETGHEEVYVVLDGSGTFTLDGTPVAVKPGDYLRVDAEVVRTATAGPDGLRFIAVGSKALPEYDGRSVL
jgi:quercetin dioxygenase-like cupin family protein